MGKLKTKWIFSSAILVLFTVAAKDFTEECPKECKCLWMSGNKAAECSNSTFSEVPKTLSSDIQILYLSGNGLYEISQHAFEDVGLNNLKKLFLRECKLQTIHKAGLSGLGIMIELDLSNNDLKTLHPDTFNELSKIRLIFLNNNQLTRLDDGLFKNLEFLTKLELNNNRILQIGVNTFSGVPKLKALHLSDNKLEHLKADTFASLSSLHTLELYNNPWRCDCFLQPFRNWVFSKDLSRNPTACAEPPQLHDKLWIDLDSSDFACKPNIIYPNSGDIFRSSDTNITLTCKVSGNPLPDIRWVLNSNTLDGTAMYKGQHKYYLSQGNIDINTKWLNLTILDADGTDNGEYVCAANNMGGVEERSLTLFVTHSSPGIIVPAGMDGNMMPVLIGISCSAAILLIVLLVVCYCCCRKRMSAKKKKGDASNGEALIEGSVIPEMEKSLINTINPVTKPPRRYDVPPSITSGTEMSELNKTLLDMDSVYAVNEDEKHSLEFERDHSKLSHEMLNYSRQDGRAYPPDLLSFPARAPQISPAASSASTVPDTTRLPPQLNPTSPLHSPIYGVNPNIFKTLPYSRSQSPFTAPITPPVVTPRQGYVTIPRRPRVPSWSSTTSTQILPSSEAQEPLYDNLGLRTTADGSSVLSLNKAGLEQQLSPMRGRPLPATPTVYQNPHPIYYAPIEEQEPAPSPVSHIYDTNHRNSVSSQLSGQLSTPGPQEPLRMSWTAKNSSTPQPEPRKTLFPDVQSNIGEISTLGRKPNKPETGSLRRNPRTDAKYDVTPKTSPVKEQSRNDSSLSLNQSGTLGRSGKIPPRPPPKPKKKPQNLDSNEPQILFEDEGEDGTEV